MQKLLAILALIFLVSRLNAAEVLIVADEFPAMQVLADALKTRAHLGSELVEQSKLPPDLGAFHAVVVYIHRGLDDLAEHAFIHYAEQGGRLVLLHHSISSGKRQNRDWFRFLGVSLPQGELDQGGYKWIEGVTVQWIALSPDPIMTNQVAYSEQVQLQPSSGEAPKALSAFSLHETEVYLNHVLTGPRTLLMGLKFEDPKTGRTWIQKTAGWSRSAGKGSVTYFMPGHSVHDFENKTYSQIVLNAITAGPGSAPPL